MRGLIVDLISKNCADRRANSYHGSTDSDNRKNRCADNGDTCADRRAFCNFSEFSGQSIIFLHF